MSYEAFDRRIDEAQQALQAIRQEAESQLPSFSSIMSAYAAELANYFIDRARRDRPEVIRDMPQEKLAKLKIQFNELLAQIPSLADKCVQDLEWAHRADIPEERLGETLLTYEIANKLKEAFQQAARSLIGNVGRILIDYGLTDPKNRSEWQVGPAGPPKYSYGLPDIGIPHAEQFKKIHEQYAKVADKYVNATKTLLAAQRAKAQAQAKDRWDQT